MQTVSWQFGLLPLFDTLSLRKGEEVTERALLERLSSWRNALPQGLTIDLQSYQIQAPDGETFQLVMPNVLSFEKSNSSNVGSLDSMISGLQCGLFPHEGSIVAAKDNRKAVFLSVQLNQLAFLATRQIENGQPVPTTQDAYIHVFLNGSLCTSRWIPRELLASDHAYPHFEVFHGENIGNKMERVWITDVGDTDMKIRTKCKDMDLGSGSAGRWQAINKKLQESISFKSNATPVAQYLAKYVSALAALPVPRQGLSELNTTYAVIDVIVVGGIARKISEAQHYPDQEISAPEQYHHAYSPPIPHDTSQSVDEQIGDLENLHLQETAVNNSSSDQIALTDSLALSSLKENTQSNRLRSGSPHSDGLYGDSGDDAQQSQKGKAATRPASPADPELRGAKSHNQDSQATLTQLSTRSEIQHNNSGNTDRPLSPVRDPITGHISNITALRLSEKRSVRKIAQFSKPNRGWRKRRRAMASQTSVASLHSSSPNRSLRSGRAKSVVWSSTSSEIRRLRAAKADLSLPRKKRRRQRYQSVDFDSEDPVAVISGTLEARIRVVPRNNKPILPLQEVNGQHDFKGPASKLVKPIIHRNLRRKRERQIVKRNPEVGLTERDVYNWIKADYDIRGGVKPWPEQQENVHVPLAQSFSQESFDVPASQLESGFERLQCEMQEEIDREHGLMNGSVITLENDITRPCPRDAEVDFESEHVIQGTRFIFV